MATSRPLPLPAATARQRLLLALLGFGVWAMTAIIAQPGWLPMLFLWAPLVLFPIARVAPDCPLGPSLCAAVLAAGSFLMPPGIWAGLLTFPWFGVALGHALMRLHAALRDRCPFGPILGLYWLVGAGWLALARFDLRPLGFSPEIVLATAAHFHFAGVLLPVLVQRSTGPRLVLPVLLGVPLVALGITLTAFEIVWVECMATWFLAAVCWVVAWAQARAARRLPGAARWAAIGSILSLAVAMVLAVAYATGNYFQLPTLDIPWMIYTHGCLQAFGFATLGVRAWPSSAEERP
jgi:hypothetical protein